MGKKRGLVLVLKENGGNAHQRRIRRRSKENKLRNLGQKGFYWDEKIEVGKFSKFLQFILAFFGF